MTADPAGDPGGTVSTDASAPAPPAAGLPGLIRMLSIASVVVVGDQLTKHWALDRLRNSAPLHVIWTLQLNLSFNSGMAFSRGQGIGPLIGVVAIVVVISLAFSLRRVGSKVAHIAGGLVIGGAIGNLVDRVFRGDRWLHGSVIDFVDLQWFPIFNVADAAITVGGVVFVFWSLASRPAARR